MTAKMNPDSCDSVFLTSYLDLWPQTEAPSMTAKMDPVSEVFCGDNLELITQVSSPDAEVFWFKDNQPLAMEPPGKYEIITDGNTKKLIIHDVRPEDKGRYACAMDAENASYTSVMIQGKSSRSVLTVIDSLERNYLRFFFLSV